MTRVGAIDCGTNSIRLLIADLEPGGGLVEVLRTMRIVRLGQGVDVTHRIAPEAMHRTLDAARTYAELCVEHDVQQVRFVATSASRDAENSAEFVDGVREAFSAFGISPEVASGDEEARLSFLGATGDLRTKGAAAPYLVVDLGGGSTELVRGTDTVDQAWSMDIGCVRMTERHLKSDPPSKDEIEGAQRDIDAALEQAQRSVDLAGIGTLVGLAGSITTITANALHLDAYDRDRIHGATLSVDEIIASCDALLHMTRAEREALPFMHPGRVDVIGAGALIWRTIIDRVAQQSGITQVTTSEEDILDGIALSMGTTA